jgi:ornithine cyclodeaminase/alanine dehydrogenase-like protein (mu-crystallin family)
LKNLEIKAMEAIKKYKDSVAGRIKLGFIGCGNMAHAIAKGLIDSRLFSADEIIISATREESFERWR